MNPKKIYLTDTGFVALGRTFTENRGRILENVVAIELFRSDAEFYYFKDRNECDFVIKQGLRPTHAIQVCWELNKRNEKREFAGLANACRILGLSAGIILTYAQEGKREEKGLKISVLPVWKWLLTEEPPFRQNLSSGSLLHFHRTLNIEHPTSNKKPTSKNDHYTALS